MPFQKLFGLLVSDVFTKKNSNTRSVWQKKIVSLPKSPLLYINWTSMTNDSSHHGWPVQKCKNEIFVQKRKFEIMHRERMLFLHIKFIYSEKATKFFEIITWLLTGTTYVGQNISQNYEAFSEYMNFTTM